MRYLMREKWFSIGLRFHLGMDVIDGIDKLKR